MNNYIKEKIVNLFEGLNLSANIKTIVQYQQISIVYNLLMIGAFTFIESNLFSLILGIHTPGIILSAFYMNMILFFVIFKDFKTEKLFPKLKQYLFSKIKPLKGTQSTYHYVADKLKGALSNIEQQFLFLSFFINIRDKYAKDKSRILRRKSVFIGKLVTKFQESLEKNDLSKSTEQMMELFFYIFGHNEVNVKNIQTDYYSDHEKKLLAVEIQYMTDFLNDKSTITTEQKTAIEYEVEKEFALKPKKELFTKPVNKIDWNKVI